MKVHDPDSQLTQTTSAGRTRSQYTDPNYRTPIPKKRCVCCLTYLQEPVALTSIFHAGAVPLPGSTGEDLREVCRLSAWGKVDAPIPRITTGLCFLPHPLPSEYSRLPCGRPTLVSVRE